LHRHRHDRRHRAAGRLRAGGVPRGRRADDAGAPGRHPGGHRRDGRLPRRRRSLVHLRPDHPGQRRGRPMKVFASPAELAEAVGAEIGVSDWLVIEQDRIDQFAEATGDHQWIHVDEARAKDGPFGSTIAHGFLTLSLLPALLAEVYRVEGVRMGINYGLNRVRFINPVWVGSSVRAVMTVAEVDQQADYVQVTAKAVVEIQGAQKPAAVAETVSRFYL